jgi:hypothetical protein
MKTYTAFRIQGEPVVQVHRPEKRSYILRPGRSLKIVNHSPTGFEWGYGGSGPAQLSLAILLDLTNDRELACAKYQKFKWDFIHAAPDEGFTLTEAQIRKWLNSLPNIKS